MPTLVVLVADVRGKKKDMLPALDNYVAYGSATLVQNPTYLRALVGMVEDIFRNDGVGGVDRICGCKLAETVMLHLRGYIDEYIPLFIELAMNILETGEVKTKSYRIHLIEVVVNAIYNNPVLSLQFLESKGWTNKFFSLWFSNIDSFGRVHDKKLSIAAISSLLTLKAVDVPVSVQPGWPRLLQGITRLFQTLPAAVKRREESTRESEFEYDDDEEDEEGNDWDGEVEWTDQDETEGTGDDDVADESTAYLDFLNREVGQHIFLCMQLWKSANPKNFGFFNRPKNSGRSPTKKMNWMRKKTCWRRHWINLNRTTCSKTFSSVCHISPFFFFFFFFF